MNKNDFIIFCKNGFYIHLVHGLLQYIVKDIYLSSAISIKLYSINYFYWYGNLYNYLSNPRHNWIKQFIRFTDTGHLASALPLFFPNALPISHNIHFIIMIGYWLGKLAFNMKDADRIDNKTSGDIIEWHLDLMTYIHHTVPYALILWLSKEKAQKVAFECEYEYSNTTLYYTYLWLYAWLIFIYTPWRLSTGDTVYSILDFKKTHWAVTLGFVGIIHYLVYLSNIVGYTGCLYVNA